MTEAKKRKRMTTSQLLAVLRKSGRFSEVSEQYLEQEKAPSFNDYLYQLMEKHQLDAKDLISRSCIERSYFYHILSGKRLPSRNMIIRLCLCMEATLNETNQLLRLAGQGALYARIRRDAAIIFSIEKKYTMQQANEFLIAEKEIPLYREETT